MRRPARSALALAMASSFCSADSHVLNDSLWQLSPEELGQIRISSIATGTATPLDKAAAVTTVITDEDIKAIGATDLDEILATVPGVHVGHSEQGLFPKYNFRGITSTYNPQTLFLVNGIPQTSVVYGRGGATAWAGMPVNAIARIEIIRGPGSALYGADAFSGVINVITKSRADINGTQVGGRAGSFDTQSAWLLHGGTYADVDVAFSLEASQTDGHREIVRADRQTRVDQRFETSVSNAPGPMNNEADQIEARLDLKTGSWRFRSGYQGRYNLGTGPGVLQALDPKGSFSSSRFNADLTQTADGLAEDLRIVSQIGYFNAELKPEELPYLLPPGTLGNLFPEGFIGGPGVQEENARLNLTAIYAGLEEHRIRAGGGVFWGDVYKVTERNNYQPAATPPGFEPRPGGITRLDDTPEAWLPERERHSYYAFIQDEWQFLPDWQLTSGLRYDRYSDFGDTLNPRLALVWATSDTVTTKFLYGRAFRAPTIQELFVTSNPVSLGNPDLSPEKIDTYEIALSHTPNTRLHYSINLFYYKIRDYITFVSTSENINQAQNVGKRKGRGGEFEFSYLINERWKIIGNYAYQRSTDERTHADVGEAPNHEIYARTEWTPAQAWRLSLQTNWVGKQERVDGDTRSAVEDTVTVDATVRNTEVLDGLELAFSVRNLFDEAVYSPSPGPDAVIPGDFPMAGRSLYAEARYSF